MKEIQKLNIETPRTIALKWWATLSDADKSDLVRIVIDENRSYTFVTGREVQLIYEWQNPEV